jgi:hypothetical protein
MGKTTRSDGLPYSRIDLSPFERINELESSSGGWKNLARCCPLANCSVSTLRSSSISTRIRKVPLRTVLETLRNVLNSLDCCEVDMKLGPETSALANQ